MSAIRGGTAQHPHFVSIPDPQNVQGVRAYHEPAVPHPLQVTFLDADRERAWTEEIRNLLSAGRAEEANARLSAEIAGFDGALARLCKATASADVALEGFEDLLPILGEWEGPAVTAITLGLTNPPDLVFEPGRTNEPELLLGLYSDEAFPFSKASESDILAECGKEVPAWVGAEEDVEFFCTMSGLAELNTALIHCKHRRFLRDGRDGVEGRAPGGYVEFVLASLLLATRFLEAAHQAMSAHGLPARCRLLVGTVDLNADFLTILGADVPDVAVRREERSSEPAFAPLTIKPWVPREDPTADAPASGPTLRGRITLAEEETATKPGAGFLTKLFHRLRRR